MLRPGFEFNQASLQDYEDCARRFQLRYIDRQPWPAVEIEPALQHEEDTLLGQRFHRVLERHFLGVPDKIIEAGLDSDALRRWWRAFQMEPPLNLPKEVLLPEQRLAISVGETRLLAVIDLLAIDPGRRIVIVDWKTGRYRPPREVMEKRLQTRVYPYVVVEAAAHFWGGPVDPARVSMIYWFADDPAQPHAFLYDRRQHEETAAYLHERVRTILNGSRDEIWPLTSDERLCGYCIYRSLCGRGVSAELAEPILQVDTGDIDVGSLWDTATELEY